MNIEYFPEYFPSLFTNGKSEIMTNQNIFFVFLDPKFSPSNKRVT